MPFDTRYFVPAITAGDAPTHASTATDHRVDAVRAGPDLPGDPHDGVAFVYHVSDTASAFVLRAGGRVVEHQLNITEPAIDRLADGRFVVVGQGPDGRIVGAIFAADGALDLGPVDLGAANSFSPDVVALADGGFVISCHQVFLGGEGDIQLRGYDASGAPTGQQSVSSSHANDRDAVMTLLANGDVAVAWRRGGADGEVRYAVYSPDGDVRVGETVVAGQGSSSSAGRPVMAATADGFVIVSEVDGTHLHVATISADGEVLHSRTIVGRAGQTNASVGVLDNGFIVVSYDDALGVRTTALLDEDLGTLSFAGDSLLGEGLVALSDGSFITFGGPEGGPVTVSPRQLVIGLDGGHDGDVWVGDILPAEVNGHGGDDSLTGGLADDRLRGGLGDDRLAGGEGDDFLFGHDGHDILNGGEGDDTLDGGSGRDTLVGADGADILTGAGQDDSLNGGDGQDRLYGGGGRDTLVGGADRDVLRGGQDADVLNGGEGDDVLTGGGGSDRFVFRGQSGSDVITDFRDGDVISLDPSIFTSFADIRAHAVNDGLGNVIIAKDGVSITLMGVKRSELSHDDFGLALSPAAPSDDWLI